MKFRRSAPAVLIAVVVATIAIISVVGNVISHRMSSSFEETQFALMGQIVRSKLNGAEAKAIAAAEMIAAIPAVKKAFAEREREQLLAATQEAFRVQHEKYGISQAHFHLAPAVSFLRVHNPKSSGEDLSHYRKIVLEVNQTNAIRKGIEITTSGLGIFGTLPMTDEAGKPTGSFEMAMDFAPLLDELKKTYGFELALFIDEKMLRETATSLKGDILSERNRVGPYVKFYSTHPELLGSLVADSDISVTEDSHYLRESGAAPYGVLLQPVYNYAKKQIGVIAVARNFSATRSADGQAMVWQALAGLLSVIVLAGAILIVLRGMILRPMAAISEHIAALADGAKARDLPDAEEFCDEMRDLAQDCERLAQQNRDAKRNEGGAA